LLNHSYTRAGLLSYPFLITAQRQSDANVCVPGVVEWAWPNVKHSQNILEMGNSLTGLLKPQLVAQIEFTEWTPDGHLRHSKFVGLGDDKDPRQVVREDHHE
jgi:ATP dependent DNA ligase C terminal region